MRKHNPTRNNLQLSQQELAAYLGVSRSVISMYERGERELPTAALIKLSELEIASTKLTAAKKSLHHLHPILQSAASSCRRIFKTAAGNSTNRNSSKRSCKSAITRWTPGHRCYR